MAFHVTERYGGRIRKVMKRSVASLLKRSYVTPERRLSVTRWSLRSKTSTSKVSDYKIFIEGDGGGYMKRAVRVLFSLFPTG